MVFGVDDRRLLEKFIPALKSSLILHLAPYIGNDGSGPNVIMCVGLAFWGLDVDQAFKAQSKGYQTRVLETDPRDTQSPMFEKTAVK